VLVPSELRSAAGLERDVMLLGMGTHFELWDLARMAKQEQSQLAQALSESAASFSF
jgi:MraZ protein